ncbi:MAG: hypothetical protein LBC56_02280 [Oscillospiraceae bacterium]|nr:hypothetical protein [Oscillospiraceae bacterium]
MKKAVTNKAVIAIAVVYTVFSVVSFLYNLLSHNMEALLYSIAAPFLLFIPLLAYRLFRLAPVPELTVAVIAFCFFAYLIGIAFAVYRKNFWYDKVIHGFAGAFFALVGMAAFYYLKADKKIEWERDRRILEWFSFAFSLLIGVFWEIFEFAAWKITGIDTQHVLATGVDDTMLDLIACFGGSLFIAFCINRSFRQEKFNLPLKLFESFYIKNMNAGYLAGTGEAGGDVSE